jgi:hypothetical protein
MLERSFDVERINAVANHPEVRPFVGPAELGELDFTDAVAFDKGFKALDRTVGILEPGKEIVAITPRKFGTAKAEDKVVKAAKETTAEKLFSMSTLHYLVSDDEKRNVFFRLEKIKEVERKIKMVDGEFVLAKDKSSTSRRDSLQDGGLGHKQMSLLGAGLKSKQKVDKTISSRIVKKKAAARA